MTQETRPSNTIVPMSIEEKKEGKIQTQDSMDELLGPLKTVKDDIGQIYELMSEEKNLVKAFFESLYRLMKPLAESIQVSTLALPEEMGDVTSANIDPTGHLIIKRKDGSIKLINLADSAHRDLLLNIVKDILPKFRQLTKAFLDKTEQRIDILSAVTKEMQSIANEFTKALT